MPNVTIVAALLAGMLSFLSPCVLPLVPPYIVYLTGASLENLGGAESKSRRRGRTLLAALIFVLGFTTVFVAFGASASAIGTLLHAYSYVLGKIAGVVIIIMGLHFLGITPITFLMQEHRFAAAKPASLIGAYVMGLAFAFGWTPCIGPILGAILAFAASEDTVAKGASLLAVYSLGLGVPFLIAAVAVESFAAFLKRFRTNIGMVEKTMGGLLTLAGVAFFGGWISDFGSWLLQAFPELGKYAI